MTIPKRKPKAKKRSVSTAKKAAWNWMSKYIRCKAADENGIAECVTCGVRKHWKELHAGHFIPKKRGLSIYFVEEAINPQCAQCNVFNGGMLIEYTRFMQLTYGVEKVDELLAVSRETKRMRLSDYEALEFEYREKFQSLGTIQGDSWEGVE